MAQYQHLPIYKVTYDLLVAVTSGWRQRQALALQAAAAGLRLASDLTKALSCPRPITP